jgi:hypothetical protein
VGGVPAMRIGRRFADDIVSRLCRIRWWELEESALKGLPFQDVVACLDLLEADGGLVRSFDEFAAL